MYRHRESTYGVGNYPMIKAVVQCSTAEFWNLNGSLHLLVSSTRTCTSWKVLTWALCARLLGYFVAKPRNNAEALKTC